MGGYKKMNKKIKELLQIIIISLFIGVPVGLTVSYVVACFIK